MTKTIAASLVGAWLLVAAPAALEAQLAVEVRGGGAVGNHTPAAAGLETLPGPSLSATALGRVMPWLSVYGTYVRSQFDCEAGFCTDREVSITNGGFGGGLRVHPVELLWVQAGAMTIGTDVVADGEEESGDPELSYEGGAGLSIPIIGAVRLVPGLMYRTGVAAEGRTTVVVGELGVQVGLDGLW